ncbi:hypothetical protein U9M48_003579 [Paspalum notatum var. saurae]|uniref:Uncharacterized protein n=1 Tax=Paspalum notatum var. saurae TaxID=547442 RepID=A0AAQ3SGZ9_PASNO
MLWLHRESDVCDVGSSGIWCKSRAEGFSTDDRV